jgi:hypothetical protein
MTISIKLKIQMGFAGATPSMSVNFMAGGLAGVAYWATIYPLELIKTRIQSEPCAKADRKYTGIVDCALKTFRNEGAGAFYKGFSVRCSFTPHHRPLS